MPSFLSAEGLSKLLQKIKAVFATKTELNALGDSLTAQANELGTTFVHKTGNETISGTKTFSGEIQGHVSGTPSGTLHVEGCVPGMALVNALHTEYGAIWNAKTKNYGISAATYPQRNDVFYLLSVTNDNISSRTNTIHKSMTWDAGTGKITAPSFCGALVGSVSGDSTQIAVLEASTVTTNGTNFKFSGNRGIIMNAGGAGEMSMYSGTGNFDGATLQMFGRTHSSYAGRWYLRASTKSSSGSSGSSADLVGYPNGTLTWKGQNVTTSSDKRLKQDFSSIPDPFLDAWESIQWTQFRYRKDVEAKGGSARLHSGLVAQDVKEAMEVKGQDACAYGVLCLDEDDGMWSVRYAEAFAIEAAYLRRRCQMLEERIATLEAKGE